MKTLKSLFMLCAGLSFCACSSDNDNVLPEGTGKVVVRIVPPTVATRTATPTTGETVPVTGSYSVYLKASSVSSTNPITITDFTSQVEFTGVTSPEYVEVKLNNAVEDFSTIAINDLNKTDSDPKMQAAPASIPAYGKTSTFTVESTTTNASGTVTTYGANVKMAIPVARLEIGNITLQNATQSTFSKLNVAGIYMDNLRTKGGKYSTKTVTIDEESTTIGYFGVAADPALQDYYFTDGETNFGKEESELAYILGETASGDFVAATEPIAQLPTSETVYAYNFYGAEPYADATPNNPQFKICFSETKLDAESAEAAAIPRYAMITKFKSTADSETEIALENGKIYKIVNATLADANIVADEDGQNVEYQVEVTVEEAAWTVETIFADWAQ